MIGRIESVEIVAEGRRYRLVQWSVFGEFLVLKLRTVVKCKRGKASSQVVDSQRVARKVPRGTK